MKKNGFTLIELIISIVLVGIILASMIGTLVSLKNTYGVINEDVEARTYSALISKVINEHLMKNNGIKSYSCSNTRCDMILGTNKEMTLEIVTSQVNTEDMKDASTGNKVGSLVEEVTTIKYYGEGYSYYKTVKHYDKVYNEGGTVELGYKFDKLTGKGFTYTNNMDPSLKDYLVNITISMNDPKYNIELYASSLVNEEDINNKFRLYTITYNSNGGLSCIPESKTVKDRHPWGTLCVPTRDGYGFKGWFVQPSGENVPEVTSETIAVEDITVYAHWDNSKYNCPAGTYLPADGSTCVTCLSDYYCVGLDDASYNSFDDQGIVPCSAGYHSDPGSTSADACKISCEENTHVANVNDAYCSACGAGYQKGSHDVIQGHTSTCTPVALDKPTISGGTTIIYGSNDVTLTCNNPSTYGGGITINYQFGYASSSSGTITNWSTASTTNTLVVSKTAYVGDRYYGCKTSISGNSSNTAESDKTLVRINNAKVTFDATTNGGVLSGTSELYTKKGVAGLYTGIRNTTSATVPTASKDGYTWNGWYTESSGGSKVYSNASTPVLQASVTNYTDSSSKWLITENKTLFAQYSARSYNLTFNCNGGSKTNGKPADTTVAYGSSYTLTSDTCTRSGYTQNGWNESSTGDGTPWTTSNTNNFIWNYTNDVILYAVWTPKTYTVTLDKGTGTSVGTTSVTATYNSATISPASITPASKSYTISGFTLLSSATSATVSSTSTLTSTATLNGYYTASSGGTMVLEANATAKWAASASGYTDSNRKWIKDGTATLYAQFGSMQSKTLPTITKSGYTCGWTTSSTGTTITYASGASLTPTGNTTLYGVCVANSVTINLNKDGSAYSASGMKVTLYNGTTATTHTATISSGSSATLSGVPAGTYNVYAGKDSNHKTTLIDSGVDVTVANGTTSGGSTSATVNYYTLTITTSNTAVTVNGTSVANNGTVVALGGTTTASSNYTHAIVATASTGYTFSAWSKTAGTATIASTSTASTTVKLGAASTINATSAVNTYTVAFTTGNSNCTLNTTTYGNKTGTYNSNLNIANPSCTGYTFTGWTANSNLDTTNAKYGTSSSSVSTSWSDASTKVTATYFKNLRITSGTVTLTANWEINSYVLTINAGDGTIPSTSGWTLGSGNHTATKSYNYNVAYGTLPTPTRANYTFDGWYTAASGGTQVTSTTKMGTSSTTVHAHWTLVSYVLTISAGTHSSITVNRTSSSFGATTGNLSNNATIYDGDILKVTFAADTGYSVGTHTVNSSAFTSGNTHTVSGNVTVASSATANSYTISYNCNGGSGTAPSSTTANYDSTFTVPTNNLTSCSYKSSGGIYSQTGWSKTSDGTAITSFTVTGAQVLYAVWSPLFTYTSTYNFTDEGSGKWNVKLLAGSGAVFKTSSNIQVDIFAVGGGGSGSTGKVWGGGGGGAGGCTYTLKAVTLASGTEYSATIGAGGAAVSARADNATNGKAGVSTTFSGGSISVTAAGGGGGVAPGSGRDGGNGGAGGSGGGGGKYGSSNYNTNIVRAGDGGTNGSAGTGSSAGGDYIGTGGTGCASNSKCKTQTGTGSATNCTNTRAFCESTGDVYAGGGGGGAAHTQGSGRTPSGKSMIDPFTFECGHGGTGGGGNGFHLISRHVSGSDYTDCTDCSSNGCIAAIAGTPNTGGGGGGGGPTDSSSHTTVSAAGGSGIIIIRTKR